MTKLEKKRGYHVHSITINLFISCGQNNEFNVQRCEAGRMQNQKLSIRDDSSIIQPVAWFWRNTKKASNMLERHRANPGH